jgi:hypothetical protein
MVLAMINTVFAQETLEAAIAQWRIVADQLRSKFPKLAAMLDRSEPDVLAYMSFPKAHRTQIHSTNPLERLNAEIKRRTDVVGIFPNDAAITRPSVRCCSSRATSGVCSVVTCSLKGYKRSPTIKPLGCPPWSTEHESNRTRTHDSYTTPWDPIFSQPSSLEMARIPGATLARVIGSSGFALAVAARLVRGLP